MTRFAALVLAFGLAGCQDAVHHLPTAPPVTLAQASNGPILYNQWLSLSFVAPNTCLGESIAVSGKAHITTTVWSDANQLRVRGHINLNLAGVGLSTGFTLRLLQLTNSDQELDLTTGAGQSEQVFLLNVVTNAAVPNSFLTMNGTFVFDPGGGSQFFPKKWTFVCR